MNLSKCVDGRRRWIEIETDRPVLVFTILDDISAMTTSRNGSVAVVQGLGPSAYDALIDLDRRLLTEAHE